MKYYIFLLTTLIFVACTSPKVLDNQSITIGGEKSILFYEVSGLLIKDEQGKRVYSGTANVYKNKITYSDVNDEYKTIPNEKIHSIYGKYRGGGLFTSIFFLGLISIPASQASGWGVIGVVYLAAYGLPISIIVGSALGNSTTLLYKKPIMVSTPNYHDFVLNMLADRNLAPIRPTEQSVKTEILQR